MYCQDTVATIFYSEFLKEKLTNFQQIRQGATYTWHLLLMYKYICMYVYTTYKYYIAWEIRKLLLFFYHSWHVWENEGSGRENGFRRDYSEVDSKMKINFHGKSWTFQTECQSRINPTTTMDIEYVNSTREWLTRTTTTKNFNIILKQQHHSLHTTPLHTTSSYNFEYTAFSLFKLAIKLFGKSSLCKALELHVAWYSKLSLTLWSLA